MLKTETLDSYYIIRGTTRMLKKEQQRMDKDKITDKTVETNLNNSKIKNFHNEEIKKLPENNEESKSEL